MKNKGKGWKFDPERHRLASHGISTIAKGEKSPEEYLDMDWANLFTKASMLIVGLGVASSFLQSTTSKGRQTSTFDGPEGYDMAFGFDSKKIAETASSMLKKKFNIRPKVIHVATTAEGDHVWGVFVPEEDAQEISDYIEGLVSKYSHLVGTAMGRRRDIRMVLNSFISGNYKFDDDDYFVIYYKDGSKRRIDRYNYNGENIERQNVRNILHMSSEGSEDFSGDVDVDDDYFAEQEKIQKMIESGNEKIKNNVRL
ncbi:hypothetical protein AKJ51_01490 [candidate division MSBL1 archaeon SCGC-AAA382A20]|uniref:Uncharacterized protein n=1 Tax=candidate division MSBL1 archaeon SCGC-AAA382A20 TaxID=1698280 RepID=A0A133VLR5_9EURY|nr:hypothetical protein AKJ51_01490 [candidate division MSBL1 archaeon SCGC-AAA382A20]